MQKKRYVPSALAAAILAGVALSAVALPASAATSSVPAPQINSVDYDGSNYPVDHDYDYVGIGAGKNPTFRVFTAPVTTGSVEMRDSDGSELCTASIFGTGSALCAADAPLSAGQHTITAITTSPDGTSEQSAPITVEAFDIGDGGSDPSDGVVAQPNPGQMDEGFTAPGAPVEPIVARPGDGPVDAGFTVPSAPVEPIVARPGDGQTDAGFTAPGVVEPTVKLGETSGNLQQLILNTPFVGNNKNGTIHVYDESGTKVIDREFMFGGSEMSVYVDAPFGELRTYQVEYVTPTGTTPRATVTIDRTSGTVDAPTFAFDPAVSGTRLIANLKGIPGATAVLHNSAGGDDVTGTFSSAGMLQLGGTVRANALNEYSIVQTANGVTSKPLTHTVDTRKDTTQPVTPVDPAVPAPGAVDAGFSPIAEPAPAPVDPAVPAPGDVDAGFSPIAEDAAPAAPSGFGYVVATGDSAFVTLTSDKAGDGEKYIIRDDQGKETTRFIGVGKTSIQFTMPVSHRGDQDITVVKVVGDKRSAETTIHLTQNGS